jgi:molecular chaperone HscB
LDSNYFEHFGIEVSFLPDLEALRRKYLNYSRENHPDYFAGDDEAYEKAMMNTSRNNQAYNTISNTFERIKYTLEILEEPVSSDDKLPPAFLMDMMEWNERIMEAGMSDNTKALEELTLEFVSVEDTFDLDLDKALSAFEKDKDRAFLTEIKKSYLERKYLLRLRDSINKFARL